MRAALLLAATLAAGCHAGPHTPAEGFDQGMAIMAPDMGVGVDGATDLGPVPETYYPGCEAPSATFLRTVYIDPAAGDDSAEGTQQHPWKTLASAFAAKNIVAGDHVVLLPGDHGSVLVTASSNPTLKDAVAWSWIDAQPGATLSGFEMRGMSRWLVTKVEVSGSAGTLIMLSGGANFVVSDASVYSAKDTASWTADQWVNKTANGIWTRNTRCVALLRNHVTNVRFGIFVSSDAPLPPDNRVDTLVRDNEIRNYSGDGMRPLGSNITFTNNSIYDVYVSAADGDPNHDDAIQGFAPDGGNFENVTIEGTWIQETTDPKRALQNDLQGISIFDGLYSNVIVRRNVVLAGAYDGISVFGPNGAVIENNTVIGTNPAHKLRIWVPSSKGGVPPVGATVRNNLATIYILDPGVTATNNVTVSTADAATDFVTFDLTTAMFDLHPKGGSPIYGLNAGAY